MSSDHRLRSYRVEAVVLRRTDYGEADRLLTVFTRERGKLRLIAKGARKPQSRKTGHLELFTCSQMQISQGRTLDLVSQVELVAVHRELSADLLRITYAACLVELIDGFTTEAEPHAALYDLLRHALARIATTDNLPLAMRHVELRLLTLAGYQPQLFYCVVSGEPVSERDHFFSPSEGGVIAPEKRLPVHQALPLSAAALKVLRYLQTRSWETVQGLQLRPALHREVEGVMQAYLRHLLERRLKSADFLLRLQRETG
jgi:DNA repair protein RecO (recombination protein O)